MLARFFVGRPIFAWVIAIVIMLAGVAAIETLPVAQYPDVAPPTVAINATYTGASAETVENSVTQISNSSSPDSTACCISLLPAVPPAAPAFR